MGVMDRLCEQNGQYFFQADRLMGVMLRDSRQLRRPQQAVQAHRSQDHFVTKKDQPTFGRSVFGD
jgi:hypothetical protein